MSNLKLKGAWNELKGKVRQKCADLADDDMLYEEGKEDESMVVYKVKLEKQGPK